MAALCLSSPSAAVHGGSRVFVTAIHGGPFCLRRPPCMAALCVLVAAIQAAPFHIVTSMHFRSLASELVP